MRAPTGTIVRARRLRRAMTLPEVQLWTALRSNPVGPYILDFYAPSIRLAVEIDGAVHNLLHQAAHDVVRDAWLRSQGVRILRFNASDVLDKVRREDVVTTIAVDAPSTAFGGPPPPSSTGEDVARFAPRLERDTDGAMPHPSEGLDTRRRRLLFRAWHRGMREMDLLMGRFCDAELGKLSEPEVDDLELLMEEADRDVLSWLTGEAATPQEFDTPVLRRLRDFHTHDAPVNL